MRSFAKQMNLNSSNFVQIGGVCIEHGAIVCRKRKILLPRGDAMDADNFPPKLLRLQRIEEVAMVQ